MTDEPAKLTVRWESTNACLDFRCTCGAEQHIDGSTFGMITCSCGEVWEIGQPTVAAPRSEDELRRRVLELNQRILDLERPPARVLEHHRN